MTPKRRKNLIPVKQTCNQLVQNRATVLQITHTDIANVLNILSFIKPVSALYARESHPRHMSMH